MPAGKFSAVAAFRKKLVGKLHELTKACQEADKSVHSNSRNRRHALASTCLPLQGKESATKHLTSAVLVRQQKLT